MSDFFAISTYLSVLLLFIVLVATGYKRYRLGLLRRKHNVHIHNNFFTLYPSEYIFSTTSAKKREFMIVSNRATYIIIISLVMIILIIVVFLVRELNSYLNTVN